MNGGGTRSKRRPCGKFFAANLGFEGMQHGLEHVTIAAEVFFAGLSTRKTATVLANAGCHVTHRTVPNWGRRFGCMTEQCPDSARSWQQGMTRVGNVSTPEPLQPVRPTRHLSVDRRLASGASSADLPGPDRLPTTYAMFPT